MLELPLFEERGAVHDGLILAMAGASDVNGDGFAEIIIGAPQKDTDDKDHEPLF